MLFIALSVGALIGVVLGLTGAGGGILAVPALTLVLGWSMTQAMPIALLAVGSAAAIGALKGFKKGLVRYRAATLIALTGILVAPFGQHLARILPERWLTGIFSLVMLIVAVRLWRSAVARTLSDDGVDSKPARARKIQMKTGRIVWSVTSFATLSVIGILAGLTTGLLGVGGGFIIVPALLRCSEITLEGIVATSLMVIALVSGGAFLSVWMTGHVIPSDSSGAFIIGTALGLSLGMQHADKISKQYVFQLLSVLIIAVSLLMLNKTFL
ncbi:MAG: sulfite exporter TauE/SafE family protein [Gallionella sp.]|nr:sulfite exporter TauE/SafE family protein [Gallionella sp.]